MNPCPDRRAFLKGSLSLAAGLGVSGLAAPALSAADPKKPLFLISLAEWSLHRALQGGKMKHMDFPSVARKEYDIDAIEHVNQFFKDKAHDEKYLGELKKRTQDLGVQNVLIMCDGEGYLGDPDSKKRTQAVENHHKWVDAAKFLGCHSIRVNAHSQGTPDEQRKLVVDGLGRLTEYGARHGINVIVENHGGLSSNGAWLASVMQAVNSPHCGTLPDFGNFGNYDRYKGVQELMPFAKGVSAKAHDFDAEGNETHTEYLRMMKIVLNAGYHGRVGIEYEGNKLSEPEGIRATRKLLERVREQLSS